MSLISSNFDVKSIIFPAILAGDLFSKLLEKALQVCFLYFFFLYWLLMGHCFYARAFDAKLPHVTKDRFPRVEASMIFIKPASVSLVYFGQNDHECKIMLII